jgi:hypothetical protein
MKHFYLAVVVASICLCLAGKPSFAEESKADKPKQFIYVLRLVPRLHSDSAWTKEPGDKTFGIARGCVVATALSRRNERENPPSVKRRQSGVATIY